MKTNHLLSLLFFCICLFSLLISAFALSKGLLGVAPEDEKYFKSEVIKCKDGSKKFTKEQLNDEFCDCPDGTDEPGTSACPEGKFYCQNVGHAPLRLFSSRVNDGICDCCDGSDEYEGKVKCTNSCWEAGKVARDKLKKKIATFQDGVTIRKREVEQAKQAIAKDEEELSKLKSQEKILKGLVQQLKERKEQVEKAEEKERLEKEKEEKRLRESEKRPNEQEEQSQEKPPNDSEEAVDELPEKLYQHGTDVLGDPTFEDENGVSDRNHPSFNHVAEEDATNNNEKAVVKDENDHDARGEASSSNVVKQEQEGSHNTEGLSREELGRLVASRWTGENAGQEANELDSAREIEPEDNPEIPEENTQDDDDYDGYSSETDEDKHKYDEESQRLADEEMENENVDEYREEEQDVPNLSYNTDVEEKTDFPDITRQSSSSWLDKIQQTVRSILQAVNLFNTPVDKSEAARVRKEYDESSLKLSKLQSRISSLTEKLKQDFGPEKEFYSFYDRCFENKENKYVYKVCPFKKASQVEGHSTTQLGQWEKFEDSYRTMQFSHGDRCWNGPDRSLKVRLRCALTNELTDVDEPSRCEYVALLSTPALCVEERLKELQHKLDSMNMDQPQSHDEL
ncbi:calmodulin-binding protein [Tasmannia lanceolata]|uniref:calmodulin-binding protein n=1 Tax=Tasmannia lanceolata TaxID=3420 RepID=UPI004062E111